jgi:hypothetical protein
VEINRVEKAASIGATAKTKEVAADTIQFAELLQATQRQADRARLARLVAQIDQQGKILAESRTVEQLRKYKELVQNFLQEAVQNGLNLEERHGFNRRGRTKVYKVITEVDKKLLELTDAVLQKQEKNLRILALIGEIQGLLISVYT